MALNIDNSPVATSIIAPLRLAFRPLFFGGILFSVIAIGWWLYFWLQPTDWVPYGGPIWWHGHEMLFGFGAAIVVGFLLTAVQTWTGVPGLRGTPLLVLVLSWLAGRLALAFAGAHGQVWIGAVDLSYLLLATLAMAYPVIKVKQWRNLMFVPMLLILAMLNGTAHWAVINGHGALAIQALHGAIMLFVLLIAVLGGRVIPSFTSNGTGCRKLPPINWLEALSILSIIAMLLFALYGFSRLPSVLLVPVAALAALANGWRYLRWGIQYSSSVPLLWSLHLAYAFIPLGFLLLALHGLGLMDNVSAALHSFTVGSIGGMILAMTSRVTLGHTGRPLQPPRLMSLAYMLIILAAVLRVLLPAWWPALASWGIALAGAG
ncbi:MAG TPA: NnrS family protein, partial [Pseudomonadales bacterium]